MTDKINTPVAPSKEALKNVYDVINKIFNSNSFYYSSEELKELKKNKDNIFL